jgi:hypothetical protein
MLPADDRARHMASIAKLLEDPDAAVRCASLWAVGKVADALVRSAKDVARRLEDSDASVRQVALQVLAKVRGHAAALWPVLYALSMAHTRGDTRARACMRASSPPLSLPHTWRCTCYDDLSLYHLLALVTKVATRVRDAAPP